MPTELSTSFKEAFAVMHAIVGGILRQRGENKPVISRSVCLAKISGVWCPSLDMDIVLRIINILSHREKAQTQDNVDTAAPSPVQFSPFIFFLSSGIPLFRVSLLSFYHV